MTVETKTESKTARRVECPSCDKKAKRVSPVTLRALLKDQFAAEIGSGDHSCCDSNGEGCTPITEETGWRFCDSPNCDVVYFSEEGDTTFDKSQLKVTVGVKETTGERPLCYCFGHSVASIKEELRTKGRSDALDDIRAKMKDPGCHCETSNPSGSCCLGSVSSGIQIAEEELEMNDSTVSPASSVRASTGRGERIAKVGTLASAVMASACCWLPLLLLAVGVSGAGIAATLEAYRPLFVVVTFGFLAAAFYFTYRPRKPAAAGEGCCPPAGTEAEGCCAPQGQRRFSMMAMNKVMLWVVTVLAVAFLLFPSYVGALFGPTDHAAVAGDMNQAVFAIEGMTCEGCATTVAQAIRQVPGVVAVEVDYEKSQAVVGTEASRPVPVSEILAALDKAGYGGELIEANSAGEAQVNDESEAGGSSANAPPAAPRSADSTVQTVFQVEGMTCEGCAAALSESLAGVAGITGVEVDFASGRALVGHPSCCQLPQDEVLSVIQEAGFHGRIAESARDSSKSQSSSEY